MNQKGLIQLLLVLISLFALFFIIGFFYFQKTYFLQILDGKDRQINKQSVKTYENKQSNIQNSPKATIDESIIVYDDLYTRPKNKLNPSLKIKDMINYEGVLNDFPISFQGNNYDIKTVSNQPYDACFFQEGKLPVLSIINANIEIAETVKLGCTKIDLRDYEIKYTHEQLKNLVSEFADECKAIEDLQNKRGLTKLTIKMPCIDISENEGHYPRYQWDQDNQKLIVMMYANVSDPSNSKWSSYDCSKSTVQMVIDPTQRKLDKVYIGKFESATCVID